MYRDYWMEGKTRQADERNHAVRFQHEDAAQTWL